jgi:transketolase
MSSWKIGDLIDMRNGYGEALLNIGKERNDVIVLDSDLQRSNKTYGYGQEHPELFFDMGIAEADMISTASGMSTMGYTVFATSFAMFLPGRCYDQIRLQVAYANSNVKLAGVSAGLTQGPDGASHQSLDDVALMRQLPNMTVIVPADAEEAYQAVLASANEKKPFYLRISRYPTPIIYDRNYHFTVGKASVLRTGKDIAIYASGIMVAKALATADLLNQEGLTTSVINIATIKPLDTDAVIQHSMGKRAVFSIEEHSILGGLGSAVAETLAEHSDVPPLTRIGVKDTFGQSAKADELLDYYGLTPPKLSKQILESLANWK